MSGPVLLVHGAPASSVHIHRFPALASDLLDGPVARDASSFLIHGKDSGDAASALRLVRQHRLPMIYLKPVILLTDGPEATDELSRAVDGVWDIETFPEPPPGLAAEAERLRQQATALEVTAPEGDAQLSFRVLRFMATRATEFTPEPTVDVASGFRYPRIEPLLGREGDQADVAELLEALESQRVLTGSFVTKAYACTHCSCAFLNFLEICADCGSSNLRVDDIVHHFRCGHTGPLSDYEQGGDLVCPKCDRELKHIGVDYDKPSLIYECKECLHRFPEPTITTSCFRCRRTTPPDLQVHRTVKAYRVSSFGDNAAAHGLDSMFVSVLKQRVRLFDYPVLKDVLFAEGHRIARYKKSESSLLILNFEGIEHIYVELGKRARELFEELTIVIVAILRESDLLSSRNESLFLALLMETPTLAAERAVERLQEGVDQLLRANLQHPPQMNTAILPVTEGMDVDAAIANLVGSDDAVDDRGDDVPRRSA